MFRGGSVWVTVLVLSFGGAAFAQDADQPVRFDGHKFVRVAVQSLEQLDAIHALDVILMSDAEGVGLVDFVVSPQALAGLDALGVSYKVLNDDIQKDIDAERARLAAAPEVDPRDRGWFDDYKTNDQILQFIDAWTATYPNLVSAKYQIGTSWEGRPIYAVTITGPVGNPSAKPGICFNGTCHAREWISPMTVLYSMDRLLREYATDPEVRNLLDKLTFYVCVVTNPDGYLYSWSTNRLWRKTRRNNGDGSYGVDWNRNFAKGWGGSGSSGTPSSDTYRGTAPFSEPETQAFRDYVLAHPNIRAHIDFHSYSQLVMWPFGYASLEPPEPDRTAMRTLGTDMTTAIYSVHQVTYTPQACYQLYLASGVSIDWVYDATGAFSWTIELRDTGEYGFQLPANQIIPTGEEIYAAVRVLCDYFSLLLKIEFPNGLPTFLFPDTPEDVLVSFTNVGGTLDPNSPTLFTRVGSSGAFTAVPLTPLDGKQYRATLPATPCGYKRQFYFSAETTNHEIVLSPPDAPTTVYEVEALPIVTVLAANMDTNPGWTISGGQWAWGRPTGSGGAYGGPDPTSGFTGLNVYGYNLSGDYTNNMPEYHLTTPAFNCTGLQQVKLGFWRWLGVERSQYDHAYLRISTNGSTWTNVWQNPNADTADYAWTYQEFDLSPWAENKPTVYLRWTMGTTDSGWTFCGWNIDDVEVFALDPAGCPTHPGDLNCDGHVDFGDINPFVLALTNPASYAATFPNCNIMNGDVNKDGLVDFGDINPFVRLLTGP
ncbi:MAG: M14 family zinc carboxypeptidase [Planctomycetota bacterium]